jgi:hypothetical protein
LITALQFLLFNPLPSGHKIQARFWRQIDIRLDCLRPHPAMVLHRHTIHPRGLSLQVKEKVYMLRKRDKKAWTDIAKEVKNVKGRRPYWKVVRAAFWALTTTKGRMKQDNYKNCGRKPILTAPLIKWVVKKMLTLRVDCDCTSTDLQRCLVKEKHVTVTESAIRRVLNNEGYYYLERDKKPKYDKDQRAARVDFAKPFSKCTPQSKKDKVHLCMDGAVFTIPPSGTVARENYIHSDTPKIWRRKDEHGLPELAGFDQYQKQVPPSRMIPIWGGLGPGGFAPVLWHKDRKTDSEEWSAAVRAGKLTEAVRAVNPGKNTGPWIVLCDNESFLKHADSRKAYRRPRVSLLHIPAKSPDLNPVEKMWGWARKRLHKMDLADLRAGIPVPGKTAYTLRVKRLLKSAAAQQVARNYYGNLRTVSKRIVLKKGIAVKG